MPLSFWRKADFRRSASVLSPSSSPMTSPPTAGSCTTGKSANGSPGSPPLSAWTADPYLVISPEGRLLWFLDGYTMTDRFPYSEPIRNLGNYIRNSVKAVVDAYDGTVKLYISDPTDPIIQTYRQNIPGRSQTPGGDARRAAQPYPLSAGIALHPGQDVQHLPHGGSPGLLQQRRPVVHSEEDPAAGGEREMEPYYTIMKLPDEKKEEFVLLLPFTPSKKDNMSAWMAARCDAAQLRQGRGLSSSPNKSWSTGPGRSRPGSTRTRRFPNSSPSGTRGVPRSSGATCWPFPSRNPSLRPAPLLSRGKRASSRS